MFKYERIMYWSEDDKSWLIEVPELPGCMADGKTPMEALENVEVILYDEYTADVAKTIGVTHFIRGLRNSKDYEYEKKIANYNFEHSGIRTIYIGAEEYEQISSSAVRERIFRQDSTDNLVPKAIQKIIKK